MKHSLSGFLHRRVVQTAGLLAIILTVAATVAWSESPAGRVKLGGVWVAELDNGMRVSVTYAAADPSGLKAVYRGQALFPPDTLTAMQVDSVTDLVAEEVVAGRNTSESTGILYGLVGGRVALILVDHTSFTHVSPTEKHNTQQTSVFLAALADVDNDGFPDAQAIGIVPASSISKRIIR